MRPTPKAEILDPSTFTSVCCDCGEPIPPQLPRDADHEQNGRCLHCYYKLVKRGDPRVGDVAFEHGSRVAVTIRVEAPEDPAAGILDRLRDLEIVIPEAMELAVLDVIDQGLDSAGDKRAASALHLLRDRLGKTAAGLALERAIFGEGVPLRDAAESAGKSHVSIWKSLQLIRKKIGL